MKKLWEKLEVMGMAVAFAEAGDHEEARFILQKTARTSREVRRAALQKRGEQQARPDQQDLRL